MESNPLMVVEIGGHTDASGSKKFNFDLSLQRAKSVKTALVQRGIKEQRILVKGYGMSKPLNSNTTDSDRALNRRTELKIISVK